MIPLDLALASVLQLSCCLLLALLWTSRGPRYYLFPALIVKEMLSILMVYQWRLHHVWTGWRVLPVVALEIGVAVEGLMLITYPVGGFDSMERSSLRARLAAMSLIPVSVLVGVAPNSYEGVESTWYYAHLISTAYASSLLVLSIGWGSYNPRAIGRVDFMAAVLAVWFLANLLTSADWIKPLWWEADVSRMAVHIGCVAAWCAIAANTRPKPSSTDTPLLAR